jgi:hypothetical protein
MLIRANQQVMGVEILRAEKSGEACVFRQRSPN